MLNQQSLQDIFAGVSRRTIAIGLGICIALIGGVLGLAVAYLGPLYALVIMMGLIGALWVIWRLENAIWAVIGVITLLPFATLPVKIVLTPTFLDLALGAALFLYVMQWVTRERHRLALTPVHAVMLLFMILSIFSFVAGMRHAGIASNIARKFAEFLLSMGFAWVLVDVLRTPAQIRRLSAVVMFAGSLAALVGIALWLMPDGPETLILARLGVIGYPTDGIIQYIEQNPELAERAIGTSVNPNSLGGLLVMVAALATPQIITRYPITGKQWHMIPVLGGLVICLILTFSRGSMIAFGVALMFIGAMRYRRILLLPLVLAAMLLILPWSQAYIERFIAGFQGDDLATQMRFGEYTDALRLISRYPLFGAGFLGAPDIDIYLGVSSVYLLIAENMGLVGLAAFITLMISVFIYAWRARPHLEVVPELHPIWLGLMAALLGALVNGVVDHYFFNLEFHHAILIFWIFVGMTIATARVARVEGQSQTALMSSE